MDFILSKIISRPPRSDRDNCDITSDNATNDILSTNSINNSYCNTTQLSPEIDTVKTMQLIDDLVRFLLYCSLIEQFYCVLFSGCMIAQNKKLDQSNTIKINCS